MYGIVILIAAQIGLPNSYEPDHSISLKPKPIISNFISIVKEPQFYTYVFTGAIAFSLGLPMLLLLLFYSWIFLK
jgi:DHA1 family bicyclomycin/chloramphenicol resistance-like MFS transporter